MKSFNINDDLKQNYKLLIGSILPRPIAWISTINEDGTNNLAPFSFFTAVSAIPMVVGFSPLLRASTGKIKDTHVNILREKEFVVNFVSEDLIDHCNLTSTELKYGDDEFSFAQLTPLDSQKIKAKRVQESKIHFECILKDILTYGEDKGSGSFITGEVLCVHVDDSIVNDGRIDTQKFNPIGRGAGNDWIKTDSIITRDRLTKAQIQK